MYNLNILDSKTLGNRKWLLCKGNLKEYLSQLKEGFYNFSIQRKIVKNQYLDTLVSTVQNGDPIPVITLTYQMPDFDPNVSKEISIDMTNVEILDGLQRTFRLWAHQVLIDEYKNAADKTVVPFTKTLKEKNAELFDTGVLSLKKIKELLAADRGLDAIEEAYQSFDIYFVVWLNLTPKEIIRKMLLLNAGQRSVSKTHQFELLFLYLWDDLEAKTDIKLLREKDANANQVKNGNRSVGEYMFTSVIVGLRSFLEGKPLRVTIDDLDFEDYQDEQSGDDVNEGIFTSDFIGMFLEKTKDIDEIVCTLEPDEGSKWFVKDTTLSGIFAALGQYGKVKPDMSVTDVKGITDTVFNILKSKLTYGSLDLSGFTQQYNVFSSRSVNIGNFIRKVVMHYFVEMLNDGKPSWETSFSKNLPKK